MTPYAHARTVWTAQDGGSRTNRPAQAPSTVAHLARLTRGMAAYRGEGPHYTVWTPLPLDHPARMT